jgi:hypothetical protein
MTDYDNINQGIFMFKYLSVALTICLVTSSVSFAESKQYHEKMYRKLSKRNNFLNTKFPQSKAAPIYHLRASKKAN